MYILTASSREKENAVAMTLVEQAAARIATAHQLGCEPTQWIATAEVIEQLRADDQAPSDGSTFLGLPIVAGEPCSDWGLQLVLRAAGHDSAMGLAA